MSASRRSLQLPSILSCCLILVLFGSALARAGIPSAQGVITGCYDTQTGALRVIDAEAQQFCNQGENTLQWQTGGGGSSGGGDITGAYAGFGLSGGGPSGEVTLSVNPNDVQLRVNGSCPSGQFVYEVRADGVALCRAAPTGGSSSSSGDITRVTAGVGLLGGGESGDVELFVDQGTMQKRVTGLCAGNEAIRAINQNGGVTCVPISGGTSGGPAMYHMVEERGGPMANDLLSPTATVTSFTLPPGRYSVLVTMGVFVHRSSTDEPGKTNFAECFVNQEGSLDARSAGVWRTTGRTDAGTMALSTVGGADTPTRWFFGCSDSGGRDFRQLVYAHLRVTAVQAGSVTRP